MHTRQILSVASIASFALAAATLPASGAFVVNGSFETAGATATNAANWGEYPSSGDNTVARVNSGASVGSYAERLTALGQATIGTAATLQQITNQATPPGDAPVAGTVYTLSFDVNPLAFGSANLNYQLGFFINGTGVVSIAQGNKNDFVAGSGYQTLTLDSTAAPAGANGFFIQFTGAAGASTTATSDLLIDNVRIAGPTVPEPASLSLLALGGLTLIRRRRA